MDFATSSDRTPHRTKETFDNFDRSRRAPSRDLRFIATTSGSTVTFSIERHRHHRRRRMPGTGTSARKKRHHHHLRTFRLSSPSTINFEHFDKTRTCRTFSSSGQISRTSVDLRISSSRTAAPRRQLPLAKETFAASSASSAT